MTYGHKEGELKQINIAGPDAADGQKPMGRRERRSIETREKIYRVALDLFAERGFSATTVDAIAEEADIGKGTFFNYFENKESILLQFGEIQLAKVGQFVAEYLLSDETLNTLIHRLATVITSEQMKSPALGQSLFTAIFSNNAIRLKMSENIKQGRELLSRFIEKRQITGEIRSDLPAMEIAGLFQMNILGTMVLWSLAPDSILKEKVGYMADAFVEGIRTVKQSMSS